MANKLPYARLHRFSANRESLFLSCERLLLCASASRTKHGLPYISVNASIGAEKCEVYLAATPRGIIIETEYPANPKLYNRLWMLEPFLGGVSYIEISNPVLHNIAVFDRTNPQANAYEMHAMPEDLLVLQTIVDACEHVAQNRSKNFGFRPFRTFRLDILR